MLLLGRCPAFCGPHRRPVPTSASLFLSLSASSWRHETWSVKKISEGAATWRPVSSSVFIRLWTQRIARTSSWIQTPRPNNWFPSMRFHALSKDHFGIASCPRLFKELMDFNEILYKYRATRGCHTFVKFNAFRSIIPILVVIGPPLCSSGQSSWLQTEVPISISGATSFSV
jgi:hypothetical protein